MDFVLFADDNNIVSSHTNLNELIKTINAELTQVSSWFKCNKLSLNISKNMVSNSLLVYLLLANCTPPIVPNSDYSTQLPDIYSSTSFTVTCWSGYFSGEESQSTTLTCNNGTIEGDDPTCYGTSYKQGGIRRASTSLV